MNSTFLERVDSKFEYTRGVILPIALLLICATGFILIFIHEIIESWPGQTTSKSIEMIFALIGFILMGILLFEVSIFFLKFEVFHYTHYPQRFNRKTQMVHVFLNRKRGKILSVPWNELYCVYLPRPQDCCEIEAHHIAADGVTVLNTFELLAISKRKDCLMQWEFIRRYMAEGPEQLANMVTDVMNIADRREGFWNCFCRLFLDYTDKVPFFCLPFVIIHSISRYITMLTCKVPRWPDEIERECRFEPDDPYLRDRNHLAPPGAVPEPR